MKLNQNPFIKESLLYDIIDENTVQCATCERHCSISESKLGFCKTRTNIHNKLYTIVYGNISSISNNPIEKKPLYHFFPGTMALTIGTWSCNFSCPFCQNSSISKIPPLNNPNKYLSLDNFESLLTKYNSQGTSFSFNEPTLLLEYAIDVMKYFNPLQYYHTYVTNMYMTEDALKLLIEAGCGAFCANVKGDSSFYKKYCSTNVDIVWRNLQAAKKMGAHVEVITLIIPQENDSKDVLRDIAHKIKKMLGDETPWHCNQYHPAYQSAEIGLATYRTPIGTLEKAYQIGRDEGLKYVYIGNVHGHKYENTYCSNCEVLLIERSIFGVTNSLLKPDNTCYKCGESIPIINSFNKKSI